MEVFFSLFLMICHPSTLLNFLHTHLVQKWLGQQLAKYFLTANAYEPITPKTFCIDNAGRHKKNGSL